MDLDLSLLSTGFAKAFETTEHWVTPGKIREFALGMSQEDFKNSQADQAFGWVMDFLKTQGLNATASYDDIADKVDDHTKDAIQQTLRRLAGSVGAGLRYINETPPERLSFLRAEWRKVYRGVTA